MNPRNGPTARPWRLREDHDVYAAALRPTRHSLGSKKVGFLVEGFGGFVSRDSGLRATLFFGALPKHVLDSPLGAGSNTCGTVQEPAAHHAFRILELISSPTF